MDSNWLKVENCNNAKCKTCLFGPTPVQLSQKRIEEINTYLCTFEATHICHTTNKTCYGALELQARVLHAMGGIKDEKVQTFLDEAAKELGLKK